VTEHVERLRKRGLQVWQIPLDEIHTISGFNPRTTKNTKDIDDLKAFMRLSKNRRNLPPIRLVERGGTLFLVQGHRRLRAARELAAEGELITYLNGVIEPDADEYTLLAGAMAENQGLNLTPVEEARAFARMIDKGGWSVAEIAEKVGRSQAHIYNRLKLLEGSRKIQTALSEGTLTPSEAVDIVKRAEKRGVSQGAVLKVHRVTKRARSQVRYHRGTTENHIRSVVGPLVEEYGVELVLDVIRATPAFFAEAEVEASDIDI
jgi:ParB family transcriptional regulator, chromosome partitioning protein